MKKRTFLSSSGIVPPFPSVGTTEKKSSTQDAGLVESSSEAGSKKNLPCQLLGLIRLYEKKCKGDEDYDETIEETVDLFNHMIAIYSRHGLLQRDSEKAEQILSAGNSTTIGGSVDDRKRGNKRGKKGNKGSNSDDLRIQQHKNGTLLADSSNSQQADEALVFIAALRLFAAKSSNNETTSESDDMNKYDEDRALLISLAAELCLAISQHIKIGKKSDSCYLAEYELLAQTGKPILTSLVNIMKMVQGDMKLSSHSRKNDDVLTLLYCEEETHAMVLNSTIKLACSLISLFGVKLSRSTKLLLDLNAISLELLTIDNDSVQASAARLLSCLPLAGGVERKTPSEIWSTQVLFTLTALSTAIQVMAPLTGSKANDTSIEDLNSSNETTKKFLGRWISFVRRDISNEQFRLRCFYRFCRGLTKLFRYLLLQDGFDLHHSNASLVDAQLDINATLGVVELFVSFPLASETVYYRTKRRLRDENIDNGLLSPRIVATEIANHIKLMGHELLDCTLCSVGGPALLPYARRIFRITYASILTSSSSPVRKVMDPTSAAQLEGKKRRWLHLSITSRTTAIITFGNAICAFGCDYSSTSRNHSNSSSTNSFVASTDSEKAITLVVGCLVEQIGRNEMQCANYDDDWGTDLERVELVSASATCLDKAIVACGGFLSMPIRSLIESVVVNALSQMCGDRRPNILLLSWSPAKISFLRLACTCITTPWQDGASSSLVDLLNITASRLKCDMDYEVSLNANTALKLCDTGNVDRAPALTYITRAVPNNDPNDNGVDLHATTTDASSLVTNIESARKEAMLARKKMEEMELAKKRKAEERRNREKKIDQEKAAKRQKAATKETSEKIQNSATSNHTTVEATNDIRLDNDTIKGKELVDDNNSTKPNFVAEQKIKSIEKESFFDGEVTKTNDEEKGGSIDEKTTIKDLADVDDKKGSGLNNESDDEAFPEIFDGGPDSDDE